VIQLINIHDLLMIAMKMNASDLHITVGVPPIIRLNGRLIKLEEYGRIMPDASELLIKEILDEKQLAHLYEHGEIDFSHSMQGAGRFRVNIYKQRGSYSMALRTVPLDVPTIDEMGLPPILKELASKQRGLILVTGPTGSGKSTTLASMINYINQTRSCHVLTLEDPIEYLHRHNMSMVNQREIGNDSNSYANALRAALRQDPDVILIGEMRDLETISIAVTAAETGHLVLSTLHTIGAVSTVDRIIDVFPPAQQQQVRVQLSAVLQGVISQQLLPKADGDGRIAAMEVMLCNPAIKNHIREGKTHQILSSLQTGRHSGMISMDASLMELYKAGVITYEKAITHAVDRESLARMI